MVLRLKKKELNLQRGERLGKKNTKDGKETNNMEGSTR